MTAIQVTGALSFVSRNGDGPQLLTEAAEFLNALAQLGVQMAVEINLRPVSAPAYTTPAHIVEHVADSGAFLAAISNPPFVAPANPTPAAPAQPEEPPLDLPLWSTMTRADRAVAVTAFGGYLARQNPHVPMAAWDAQKPLDWPSASGIAKVYAPDGKWMTLAASWSQ